MGVLRESGEEGVCAPRGEFSKDLFFVFVSVFFFIFFPKEGWECVRAARKACARLEASFRRTWV